MKTKKKHFHLVFHHLCVILLFSLLFNTTHNRLPRSIHKQRERERVSSLVLPLSDRVSFSDAFDSSLKYSRTPRAWMTIFVVDRRLEIGVHPSDVLE